MPTPPAPSDREHRVMVHQVDRAGSDIAVLQLSPTDDGDLPEWEPGAHIDLLLPSGLVRQYSLCGDPRDRTRWQVAVHRAVNGRGGSAEVHARLVPGTPLTVRGPRNNFPLRSAPAFLFLAGGIGITPILPMVRAVADDDIPWRLVYGGRSLDDMAFSTELSDLGRGRVRLVPQDTHGLPDLEGLLHECVPGTAVYCCGPAGMLDAVEACARRRPDISLHTERFSASPRTEGMPRTEFELELRRSGRTVVVPADRSILDVVLDTVGEVRFSCEEGVCGSCETAVLEGIPQHNDDLLSEEERAANNTMMICVGRSLSPRLVLDL